MLKIGILNGPNLNRLGTREPSLYGTQTLEDLTAILTSDAQALGATLSFFQSNHEGALIDKIETWADEGFMGLIINPAAYGHTSIALLDALQASKLTCIEVHISDIKEREPFRHHSYTAQACTKTISGLGLEGYRLALKDLAALLKAELMT